MQKTQENFQEGHHMELKKQLWNRMCHIELRLIALNELLKENENEVLLFRPFCKWYYKHNIKKLSKEHDEVKSRVKIMYPEMI